MAPIKSGTDGAHTPRHARPTCGRRRMVDACLFMVATTMLISALTTMYIVMTSTSPPVDSLNNKLAKRPSVLDQLRDEFCARFMNLTSLQRWVLKNHPGEDVERLSAIGNAPATNPGTGGSGCSCDCMESSTPGCVRCASCPSGGAADAAKSFLRGGADAADKLSLSLLGAQIQSRFTDMTCYLHGDETELCAYDHAICYDGVSVVFTVPVPPSASKGDPSGRGEVLGDPTGACYDYRYYEPTALEFSNCKYDLFKFNRVPRASLQPIPSVTPPAKVKGGTPSGTPSRSEKPSASPKRIEMHPASDWALPLNHRRWGPLNRGAVRMREVQDTVIFGTRPRGLEVEADGAVLVRDPNAVAKDLDAGASTSLVGSPGHFFKGFNKDKDIVYKNLTANGVNVVSVTKGSNPALTVYWMNGAMWVMAFDAQFERHIYHGTTRLMALFHAQRQNKTEFGEVDGDGYLPALDARNHPLENNFNHWRHHALTPSDVAYLDSQVLTRVAAKGKYGPDTVARMRVVRGNKVRYHTSSDWALPPQDYVVVTGPSSNFNGTDKLITFLRGLTELVSQPQTKFLTTSSLAILSPNSTLLCAKRGAITGTHPRMFVNKADAWMFRQYAYSYANAAEVGLIPHGHHPPRKITVLLRKTKSGRNFENLEDVIRIIEATGLPVEFVEDMGRMSFKQQILKMAETGILVAAHGAALVNSMFLPQHAVVIEIFPWMFKKMTYSNLASMLSLWYLPIYTGRPNLTDTSYYGIQMAWKNSSTGQNFIDGCVNANVSSVDALLHFRCNAVSKALPILVPLDQLRDALREGIDIIAAYSAYNTEWNRELAYLKGTPRPVPKASPSATPKAGKGASASPTRSATRSRTPSRGSSHSPSNRALASHTGTPSPGSHTPTRSTTRKHSVSVVGRSSTSTRSVGAGMHHTASHSAGAATTTAVTRGVAAAAAAATRGGVSTHAKATAAVSRKAASAQERLLAPIGKNGTAAAAAGIAPASASHSATRTRSSSMHAGAGGVASPSHSATRSRTSTAAKSSPSHSHSPTRTRSATRSQSADAAAAGAVGDGEEALQQQHILDEREVAGADSADAAHVPLELEGGDMVEAAPPVELENAAEGELNNVEDGIGAGHGGAAGPEGDIDS